MHRSFTRALAGGLALSLLLAACGDDGDDEGTDDPTTTEATEDESTTTAADDESTTTAAEDESTTTTGDDEGDGDAVAAAESVNLTIEDFAEGWTEEESSGEEGSGFNDCFTTVDVEEATLGKAETPTFSAETPDGSGGQVVTMQTVVFDSADTATSVLAEIATAPFADCVAASVAGEGDAAVEPTVDETPVGEESLGIRGQIALPADDGSAQNALLDLHAIRTGAVASFTLTLDIGETPSTAFDQTLAEIYVLIADRQAAVS